MAENSTTLPNDPATEQTFESKGKGKATAEDVPHDDAMGEDEDEDDSSSDDDENLGDEEEEGDDDGDVMGKIDLNNIVEGGRRTRGQKIDYAKAAEENPAEDDDDEDDEEFEPTAAGGDTEMSG